MNREKWRASIRRHEGLRLKPYTDTTQHLSIGYGRNLTDNGISEEEADLLLEHDLDATEQAIRLAWLPFNGLDEVRQRAVAEMGFNLGIPGLMKFHGMLGALEAGDYGLAAAHALNSLWAAQVGLRARRLARMLLTGEDPV